MAMEKFRASPLPVPPMEYDRQHIMQMIRTIELYHKQLDSQTPLQAEYFKGRGDKLTIPFIASSDSTNQYATASNTPTKVVWDTLEASSGFTVNGSGAVVAQYPGVYYFTYSLEFVNTANGYHNAVVWLRVNNFSNDIPRSATKFTLPPRKSTGAPSYVCAYSEITFALNAGDEVDLYWATDQAYAPSPLVDGIYMQATAAQTVPYAHPAIPSAVGSITFISALP